MFSLYGKNGTDVIMIKPIDSCGYGHDGTVYKCELVIVAGCLGVNCSELYVYEGEIERFAKSLIINNNELIGKGVFSNEDLNFTVTPEHFGHMNVEGVFNQNNGDAYMCRFGFQSDITCIDILKRKLSKCIQNSDYFLNDDGA